MKRFKLLNNITGWVVCFIACAVYLMTIEPTASFWDCGEFIATAYKLEIGHPPGAPFFMMMGRLFSLFASDPSHVAMMVNSFSALCSGFCILFLFWTITHLARKMVLDEQQNSLFISGSDACQISLSQIIAILGSGVVGALAYTFTDTFWFSAVEGEVYAFSSLFTAVVFWAILKWEDCADEPYANRWLVFIAYLMGLSVGVHLLNLLTIPVLVLVFYFRKSTKPTYKGAGLSLLLSVFILAAILYGIIPGFAEVAGWFELFFVNTLGMSYNVGTIVYAIIVIATLIWGIKETFGTGVNKVSYNRNGGLDKKRTRINVAFILSMVLLGIPFFGSASASHIVLAIILVGGLIYFLFRRANDVNVSILNTILICCTVLLLGYSTYAALVIRSAANPPMDENSPDDVFALKSYLNRDQYGDNPLFYGYTYASEYHRVDRGDGRWSVDVVEKDPLYAKAVKTSDADEDHYVLYDHKKEYKYCPEMNMLFPRMYSKQPNHVAAYKEWAHIKGHKVRYQNMGQTNEAVCPTFGENLTFFFKYQIGFMYWRYFMWNFVGRQNDIQGHGEITHGNWLSGISFIDNLVLGDQSTLPAELANNKGRNTYYFLPFILGILGILYQFSKQDKVMQNGVAISTDKKQHSNLDKGMQSFWLVFFLFLMTGLAIVVYLNQTPYQPRERDYAYAGSFYAFCIWIGLGVLFLFDLFNNLMKNKATQVAAAVATLLGLSVPAVLAQQNWDDHDRSDRYTCRDFGANYLLSLAPNSIIFTNGDNDTFPLWYNQEVEGVGEDERVANLSYLQMGWYVSQMAKDAYKSKAMPISLKEKDYMLGRLDVAYLIDGTTLGLNEMSVQDAIRVLTDESLQQKVKEKLGYGDESDMQILPVKKLYLEVDSAEAVQNGGVTPEQVSQEIRRYKYETAVAKVGQDNQAAIYNEIQKMNGIKKYRINLDLSKKSYLGKHEIFILDLLANNHWKRPVYYAVTVGRDNYLGLERYFRLEGMAYRVMPVRFDQRSETSVMYDNMMNKFKFGNANHTNVYLEENNMRMATTFRHMFARLAADLYEEGKMENNQEKLNKAKKVLDYCQEMLPSTTVPHDFSSISLIDCYYKLGEKQKADAIADEMANNCISYLTWISKLNHSKLSTASYDFNENLQMLQSVIKVLDDNKNEQKAKDYAMKMYSFSNIFRTLQQENPDNSAYYDEEE